VWRCDESNGNSSIGEGNDKVQFRNCFLLLFFVGGHSELLVICGLQYESQCHSKRQKTMRGLIRNNGRTARLTTLLTSSLSSSSAAVSRWILLLGLLLTSAPGRTPCGCHAFLYVGNETYPSLPALFGRYMAEGRLYQARLQYFHDNPSLCELDDKTRRHFVVPQEEPIIQQQGTTGNATSSSHTTNLARLPALPIAILVSRGNCPFQQKAVMAESLHPSVEFLIVYNYDYNHHHNDNGNVDEYDNFDGSMMDEEDTVVPMYSDGFSRLVLLSVTHRTGQSIKQYLAARLAEDDDGSVSHLGGPIVRLDAQPPVGYVATNVQSMILSAMGLFFMLLSFAGCIVILAGTFTQLSAAHGNGSAGGGIVPRRTVLYRSELERLDEATTGECAICLDTIEPSSGGGTSTTIGVTTAGGYALPCGHVFHKDCICPWLLERQAKCPLCKMDLLDHYEEQRRQQRQQQQRQSDGTTTIPACHRRNCFGLRWPYYDQVEQQDEVELPTVNNDGDDDDNDDGEVSLSSSSSPAAVVRNSTVC
jgi:hypothetical protein